MDQDSQSRCPECGAELEPGAIHCWLCQERNTGAAGVSSPCTRKIAPASQPALQFSLASLFVLTTIVAVSLGVFLLAPGLGIALVIAIGPALVREFGIAGMWRKSGRPLSAWEHGLSLLGSVALMVAIGVSSFVAFVAVCLPLSALSFDGAGGYQSGANTLSFFLAWVLGIAAGLLVSGLFFYYLWLHWHFRFYREAKPPTFADRAVGALQFAFAHVAPLLLAYGLSWAVADWIYAQTMQWPRPSHEGSQVYISTTITFVVAWGLMILLQRVHFRSFTLLMALAIGASLGLIIAWAPWYIEARGFVGWPPYGWLGAVLGGVIGLAIACRWPLPRMNQKP